ncbi:AEC family transporter [Chordicoccus furentiruminis]|uniref:AEC family transporter n=1 Tax=Chordicoccus furentiruminis TaxID=2709410 RepID=UPI0023A84762|nr:AEC family transporter [Chordicoccus furentiruminis]
MAMSLALMKNLISMMLMVVTGFGIVRVHFLKSADAGPLTKLTAYVLTPCLILQAFQRDITPEQKVGFFAAVAVSALIFALFILIAGLLRRTGRIDAIDEATLIYMNCGNLIMPLVQLTLGEEMVFYSCAIQVLFNLLAWSHGQSLFIGGGRLRPARLLLNPNVLAILISVALMLAGIRLPQILMTAVSGFGNMVGPASMLIIGMVIAESDLREVFTMRQAWLINAGRLVVLPLIAMLLLYATGWLAAHPDLKPVMLVLFMGAAAPPAATVSQLAVLYQKEPVKASRYNVLGTLLCVVTLPAMILLFQMLFGA